MFEERWCKYCIAKTKQEILFVSSVTTHKRKRKYKCTKCGKVKWMQGYRPSAESVY